MFRPLVKFTHIFEDGLLITLLISMIVLASGQIILRNFFETGYVWIDPLLRLLVLWTGLIGATVASRDNKHIRIDLLSHILPKRFHMLIQFFVGLFTAFICSVIAWYGVRWVQIDYQDGILAFEGLPAWALQSIIPLAFGLIAIRYLIHSAHWLIMCIREKQQDKQ